MASLKIFVVLLVIHSTATLSNCQPIGKLFTPFLHKCLTKKVKATFIPFCFISADDDIAKELKEEIQNLSVEVENIEESERLINHSK